LSWNLPGLRAGSLASADRGGRDLPATGQVLRPSWMALYVVLEW